MSPSGSVESQGEQQDAPIPNPSAMEVAFSLRDAINERLKTYNEALSETACLYGTSSAQDPSVFVTECNLLVRDISNLNNMISSRPSWASIFGLVLLWLALIGLVSYLTEPDVPDEKPPSWIWLMILLFFSQMIDKRMSHKFAAPRVKAALEKIKMKVINKESVSPQEIAGLKKWYWVLVRWVRQTPNV